MWFCLARGNFSRFPLPFGGVLLGTAVLGGGIAVVAIGVTYLGYKLYELKDASDETKRINAMLSFFSQQENLRNAILQTPYGRTF